MKLTEMHAALVWSGPSVNQCWGGYSLVWYSCHITAAGFRRQGCGHEQKRDRAELEARRLEGAHLLQRGTKPAEVARRLQVSRTSVWRWGQALDANGRRALRKAPRTGARRN